MAPFSAILFALLSICLLFNAATSEVIKGKVTRKAAKDYNRHATIGFNIKRKSKEKMIITFDAFGKSWRLSLRKNTMLFADTFDYEEKTMEGVLKRKRSEIDRDAYWIGPAEAGLGEGGMAAFCIQNGKLMGYVTSDESDLEIEPDIPLKMLKERALAETFGFEDHKNAREKNKENWRGPAGIHLGELRRPHGRRLNLETGVIIEKDFQMEFKKKYGDGFDIGAWIVQIFNGAQLWYLHPNFGYQVWLTLGKVILVDGNFPVEYKKASLGVYSACQWQSHNIKDANSWDNVVMFTTNVKIMAAGGRAIRASACGSPLEHCASVGPMGLLPGDISRGVAHESAHTIGMPDDYTFPTGRVCQTGLMRHHQMYQDWSRCSVQRFEEWLRVKGNRTSCLLRENTPGLSAGRKPPNMPLNVAWRARAEQSSTKAKNEFLWGAWKAVDGSTSHAEPKNFDALANISSCARTEQETDPWLRVKLPVEFLGKDLHSIRIIFPDSKAGTNMKNIEVRAGKSKNFDKQTKCFPEKKMLETKYGRTLNLNCEHATDWMAQYITVKKKGRAETLTVCEVYAFKKLQVKNYKQPTIECLNEDPLCWDWMTKCTDKESDVRYKCPFTCGDCKGGRRIFKPKKPSRRRKQKNGCADRNQKFCKRVKEENHCATRIGKQYCKTTCNSCTKGKAGQTTPAPSGPPATHSPGCKDKRNARTCGDWKIAGYCRKKKVKKNCQLTCGVC